MNRSQSPTMTLEGGLEEQTMKRSGLANSGESAGVSSPQPVMKSSTKIKDLERLLAKCKESLKLKNSQIQTLKDSLGEVEKFKEFNEDLKRELADLKAAHETYQDKLTLSIAENKRVLHQEIENKNAEMDKLKSEIADLQARLTDSNNKSRQLKSSIQDLESRLVSTSAAHQRERENLTKELTMSKNAAIKQLRAEHELNIERVKVDLEKSIEALKQDILRRDEQIIKDAELQHELRSQNHTLIADLDSTNRKLNEQIQLLDKEREGHKSCLERLSIANSEIESLKSSAHSKNSEFESQNECLRGEIEVLNNQLKECKSDKLELEGKLSNLQSTDKNCNQCEELQRQASKSAEDHEQSIYELNTRLDLMTTANNDQEKEIKAIVKERDCINESYKCLKSDFEELAKRNETMSKIIKENEIEMQSQQEQIDLATSTKQDLENAKRENLALVANYNQVKAELEERNKDLSQERRDSEALKAKLAQLESRLAEMTRNIEELIKEKELLTSTNKNFNQRRRELDEQLVVRILAALKHLETPNASPDSDKTYDIEQYNSNSSSETNSSSLPDLLGLSDKLYSLALDRSNAYLTATQRLQAVLLENTMMGEDLRRLREELNNLNQEKNLETQCSMEETERLKTENQALIHDQKSYDDRVTSLEAEVASLSAKLAEKTENEASDHTYQIKALQRVLQQYQEENQKLKESQKSLSAQIQKDPDAKLVPDSTQFEYLKNIIYQFMLGKEPLVLARVISAVLEFNSDQVEQVCKIQEAVQSALRQLH